MRKKFFSCCFSIVGSLLIVVYTIGFTFAPVRIGKKYKGIFTSSHVNSHPVKPKYQDPLLPFIHAENKISQNEFKKFLDNLSAGQKAEVWRAITGDIVSGEAIGTLDIIKKLHWVSSHWITYKFTEFDYHEMTMWTAEKLGVDKEKCEKLTTFQLEHVICEKLFEKMWDKLSLAEREKILKENNLDHRYATMSGAAVCAAVSATLAAGGIAAAAMGWAFYVLMAKTVVVLAATLTGATAATTISVISVFCGPIGWMIAGGTAITAAILVGRADVNKCAGAIVQIHVAKIRAMNNSEVDISQYLRELK